jgi:hypothetical protein
MSDLSTLIPHERIPLPLHLLVFSPFTFMIIVSNPLGSFVISFLILLHLIIPPIGVAFSWDDGVEHIWTL